MRQSPHVLTAFRHDAAWDRFDTVYRCCGPRVVTGEIAALFGAPPGFPPGLCPLCVPPDEQIDPHELGLEKATVPGNWRWAPMEMAFSTEPQVGHRGFVVVAYERRGGVSELRLASLTGRLVWEPRQASRAVCMKHKWEYGFPTDTLHEAPWPACDCGIWATRDEESMLRELSAGRGHLAGEVSLWGRVLEFTNGWRAELAYPKTLRLFGLPPGLRMDMQEAAQQLEASYGIPVEVSDPPPETIDQRVGRIVSRSLGIAAPGFFGLSAQPVGIHAQVAAVRVRASTRAFQLSLQEAEKLLQSFGSAAAISGVAVERLKRAEREKARLEREAKLQARRAKQAELRRAARLSCAMTKVPHGPHTWGMNGTSYRCTGVQSRAATRPSKTHRGRK